MGFGREQFNKNVTVDGLVSPMEETGNSISLQKDPSLTDVEREFATNKLFSEPEVINQLRYAKANRDPDFTAYSRSKGKFAKLVEEINGNRE